MKERYFRLISGAILSFFLCLQLFSQGEFNPREFFVEAESFFLFEEYSDALPLYQRILSKEPQNYNVMYKIGVCYLNDPYQKNRSIKYLAEAANHINPKYKLNSYREKLAPPDALYYLGQAYRVNGQLDNAIEKYSQFKNSVDPSVFNFDVVNAELASCEAAKNLMQSPIYKRKSNLGEFHNSRFAEVNTVLSGDGKSLIFTRKLQFYDAVFISAKEANGTWTPPYNLTPDFGLDGNSYTTGLSFEGDEVFVYRSDNFDGNIYSSKKVDGVWQKLTKLNENINTKYWESHASPSPDGKYLYFTSNRKGGYGGLDIYRSAKLANGQWGPAVNLGPVINSPYNEETPFISSKDNRLFFSSLGHSGMGGYDIFISEKIGPDKWAKPVNMGYPLNTTDNDVFFCPVDLDEISGIYSLYEQSSTYGLFDMYWIEVYNSILPRTFTLKGMVNAPAPELLLENNVTASLVDNKAGKIVSQVPVDSVGNFTIESPQGDYQLLIDGKGIKPVSIPVVLSVNQEPTEVDLALITAVAAPIDDDKIVIPVQDLPELALISEEYVITDSVPVIINLEVEPESELKVETSVHNNIVNTEEFHVSKDKFTYQITPEPGETLVLFTLTDKVGNVNQKEVKVYYTPKIDEATFAENTDEAAVVGAPTAVTELALLAGGGLQTYLLTLGDVDYTSKIDLYNMLLANAEANDYTEEDVNNLFAVLLSQRNSDEFIRAIKSTPETANLSIPDSLLSDVDLPLALVSSTRELNANSVDNVDMALIALLPYEGLTSGEQFIYIQSFMGEDVSSSISIDPHSEADWISVKKSVPAEKADSALDLASTTTNLDFFYQNLLVSTEGSVRQMLTEVDFDESEVKNSIDLVNYMFTNAENYNLSVGDVIKALDASNANQDKNVELFKDALAENATGQLKLAIDELDLDNQQISSYEDIINALLKGSRTSGYNPQELYDMLIKLIGITSIDEFIRKFIDIAPEQLDSLVTASQDQQFSNPTELIQYLISQSSSFDYTESDINNLLLRMLLEKGIDKHLEADDVLVAEKLIKRRRTITTVVLVGILSIILFFIFRRRKKQQNE